MLRVLFGALLLGISAQTYAQELPPIRELFRIDSAFSGTFSPGELEGYGMGAIVEMKYNINPYLSVGSRTDGTVLVGVDIGNAGEDVNAGIRILVAEHVVIEALAFPRRRVTPYAGLGLGKYISVGDFGGTGGAVISFSNPFGLAPHVGFDFGKFRLTGTYNKLFDSAELVIGAGAAQEVSSDYFSVEMGFLSFGGRRKPETRWFPEKLPPRLPPAPLTPTSTPVTPASEATSQPTP